MVKDTLLSSATNSEQATPLVPLEFDRGSITLPVAVERGAMELNSCAEINRYTLVPMEDRQPLRWGARLLPYRLRRGHSGTS